MMTPAPSSLADRLSVCRSRSGLTIKELSEQSGVSIGTISEIETGKNLNPGVRTLEQIAEALNIKINTLLA